MSTNTKEGFEIDEKSLDSILAEVEQELEPVLKAEKARLAKADDESAPPEESGSDDKGPPPADDGAADASAPPASPDAPPAAGGPPPPPGPDASASAPPAGSPPAGASPGLPADPAALAQMVAGMPLEQQKALYLASKQALAASMSAGAASPAGPGAAAGAPPDAAAMGAGAPPAGPGAGAPPMAPPPPAPPMGAPPADASGAPPMDPTLKGEMKPSEGNGGDMKLGKSEKKPMVNKELEDMKALAKSQGEKIELLQRAVTHMVGTPIRKAVTSVTALKKTEEGKEPKTFTKAEVNSTLTAMIKSRKLNKDDSEKVRKFYDEGSTNFNLIEHLFQ